MIVESREKIGVNNIPVVHLVLDDPMTWLGDGEVLERKVPKGLRRWRCGWEGGLIDGANL